MKISEQFEYLNQSPTSFKEILQKNGGFPIRTGDLEVLQLNVSRRCNLNCRHCHVEAGSHREEMMTREIFQRSLELIEEGGISVLDLTGGAPEMNPHLEWFIQQASDKVERLIVRSNLVILKEEDYRKYIEVYLRNKVEVCASLPSYTGEQSDRQRGCGIFQGSIEVLRDLNQLGYGQRGSGLVLDLVHNPVGAFLPGRQDALEHEYKIRLWENHSVQFNRLFCITNMPLGRYLEYLVHSGNYEEYMNELVNGFNSSAAEAVMCRNTLSVGWDGSLYNCDFNQMLELPAGIGSTNNLLDFKNSDFRDREVVTHNHCFGCTAGSGSSCQGELQ